jgi:hypothetical protein
MAPEIVQQASSIGNAVASELPLQTSVAAKALQTIAQFKHSHIVLGTVVGLSNSYSPVIKLALVASSIVVAGAAMGLADGLRAGLAAYIERALARHGK